MTQDERWIARYNEVMEFMVTNHRNPSRHRIEEHDMLNWLKANRKVMNDKYHIAWGIVDEEGHGRMMQLQSGYGIGNIEKDEEKDSGFYLRNYKGYKAPAFEALYVWDCGDGRDIRI